MKKPGTTPWPVAVSHGRVIVEGFIDFDYEITSSPCGRWAPTTRITTSFCDPIGHVQVSGDYVESWQPHPCILQRSKNRARSPRP